MSVASAGIHCCIFPKLRQSIRHGRCCCCSWVVLRVHRRRRHSVHDVGQLGDELRRRAEQVALVELVVHSYLDSMECDASNSSGAWRRRWRRMGCGGDCCSFLAAVMVVPALLCFLSASDARVLNQDENTGGYGWITGRYSSAEPSKTDRGGAAFSQFACCKMSPLFGIRNY